ncbi:MAG: LON peptidase substrate-binding domain-containing protein [Cyclobacteriaceae bacterium]|nr:LON peptidase substrate-binding domain-containing protein [Cyclobacteriaceae bacterium]
MQKELGLFPLNLVAFPGERLNLHIFEPRYKQLVNDCLQGKQTFGIPSFVHKKIEFGTEMRILNVSKRYDDGRMDICTEGIAEFKVIDFQNPWNDRLYAGGRIEILTQDRQENAELTLRAIDLVQELFSWLQVEDKIKLSVQTPLHEYVHKIGLKLEEEYDLLQLPSEEDRLHFLIRHLKSLLPTLERAEMAREKIMLNGHFKHLDPLNF